MILLSDNGSEFIAKYWEDLLVSLGIEHRRTTPTTHNATVDRNAGIKF